MTTVTVIRDFRIIIIIFNNIKGSFIFTQLEIYNYIKGLFIFSQLNF